jgi:multidrug resistance efflux pump
MKKNYSIIIMVLLIPSLLLAGCQSLNGANNQQLHASGTISALQVDIASEVGGMVVSVNVSEGQQVKKGDELFRLDDSLLKAQRDQAEAAVAQAEAAYNAARSQYDLALNAARLQDLQNRTAAWSVAQPNQFELPVWYFNKEEKISSAQAELDAARASLTSEEANLQKILSDTASQNFLDAEKRVADAQVAFLIADQVLQQANRAQEREELQDFAQSQYDAAETELESAQTEYNRLLTTQAAENVLEGRARVRVAQERYDRALDYYNSLMSGEQSLQVKAADAAVKQAEAALSQAEAALALIDVQLKKTMVTSPMDGTVLSRNLEVGETLAPTAVVLTIGQLEEVNLTVYIPETEYGKIKLGEEVSITVDSFPGKTFSGTVSYISDQAEFTPSNVQTIEGRRTTVYAVKLEVPNPDGELKPGMPADVTFNTP